MKIIQLHTNEQQLIKKARRKDRNAQKQLFEKYSPKMLGVCRQYIKDVHYAEEVMLSGFMKVFSNLKKFENKGSFEGWIRRIIINTCLSFLRKKNPIQLTDEDYVFNEEATNNIDSENNLTELQRLIDGLPEGYKTVFNLYAIEGYKHTEISELLNITESTSKSQLFKARKMLQTQVKKLNSTEYGTS